MGWQDCSGTAQRNQGFKSRFGTLDFGWVWIWNGLPWLRAQEKSKAPPAKEERKELAVVRQEPEEEEVEEGPEEPDFPAAQLSGRLL